MTISDKITVIYWNLLEFLICPVRGHTREYADFQWCTRCYKSFWEELE
jgi:uncharacterized protein with PIN domain